ncbi:MAG: ABC transporter permease [Rhodospirillales bacterium]|nr:ABC transporter permease [Rhodospirillales bacterium]
MIRRLPALLARTGIYWLLLLLLVLASAAIPEFRTPANLANVLTQSAPLAVLAVGQTLVITAGLIDLSVGQLAGLVVVLVCALADGSSAAAVPVVALALLLAAAVGALNGVLSNRLRIDPLILTFGMLSVLQGVIFVWTDRSIGRAPPELLWLANERLLGVPVSLVLVAAVALACGAILRRSRLGLHLAALGGSEESARRVGVPTARVRLAVFTLSGLSAGLAGILIAGRLGTGYPMAGAGYELDAIVAVVLGGTALAGGRGSIAGTLAAVLVLGIVSNALNLLQISAFVQMVAKGLIVIAAILANQPRARTRVVAA